MKALFSSPLQKWIKQEIMQQERLKQNTVQSFLTRTVNHWNDMTVVSPALEMSNKHHTFEQQDGLSNLKVSVLRSCDSLVSRVTNKTKEGNKIQKKLLEVLPFWYLKSNFDTQAPHTKHAPG